MRQTLLLQLHQLQELVEALEPGEDALDVDNPLNLEQTIRLGKVEAMARDPRMRWGRFLATTRI